jgi:23S rRNA U2552 (ribose-2'-O)-methylase RlmE/FtsJ
MNSLLLPKYPYIIPPSAIATDVRPTVPDDEVPCVSATLKGYLDATKRDIGTKLGEWDCFKRYTNPHEYVHTMIPGMRSSVCRRHTISRAFFKLHEILTDHGILMDGDAAPYRSFHLAEGPGGFLEAARSRRQPHENENDQHVGMTLVDGADDAVPGWGKLQSYLARNPTASVELGESGTGDLLDPANLKSCFTKYGSSMDLVTGDGGFDFSADYNKQEHQSLPLLLAQISFATAIQRHGGTFVVKVFDMFSRMSVDIAFLLNSLYDEVHIHKPLTSRCANSERYLVCRGFRVRDAGPYAQVFHKLLSEMEKNPGCLPTSLFAFPIPRLFLDKLQEINAAFGQQQIENIKTTLSLIRVPDADRIEQLRKTAIHRCVTYCQKYDLPHGKQTPTHNVFLTKFPTTVYGEQST